MIKEFFLFQTMPSKMPWWQFSHHLTDWGVTHLIGLFQISPLLCLTTAATSGKQALLSVELNLLHRAVGEDEPLLQRVEVCYCWRGGLPPCVRAYVDVLLNNLGVCLLVCVFGIGLYLSLYPTCPVCVSAEFRSFLNRCRSSSTSH